jgi:hypothetical protein
VPATSDFGPTRFGDAPTRHREVHYRTGLAASETQLVVPERDGFEHGGEAGAVSKVSSSNTGMGPVPRLTHRPDLDLSAIQMCWDIDDRGSALTPDVKNNGPLAAWWENSLCNRRRTACQERTSAEITHQILLGRKGRQVQAL